MSRVVPSQVVSFIDEVFPTARSESRLKVHADKAPVLLGILDLVKNIPAELIQLSGSEYTDFIMGVSGLEHIVRTWETRGHGTSPPDRIKGTHPVVLLRRAMAMCPDEAPSATTADLLFIDDLHYRENIRNDVSGAGKALHNGEWKAATVLAGSALEALLLWAIQSKPSLEQLVTASETLEPTSRPKSIKVPETWTLHQYIGMATQLQLISCACAMQARLAGNFRNLIHPGRAKRLAQVCDRATALSAIAAVEHVVRDLQGGGARS